MKKEDVDRELGEEIIEAIGVMLEEQFTNRGEWLIQTRDGSREAVVSVTADAAGFTLVAELSDRQIRYELRAHVIGDDPR